MPSAGMHRRPNGVPSAAAALGWWSRPARRAGATVVTSAFGAEEGWGCRATGPAITSTQGHRDLCVTDVYNF